MSRTWVAVLAAIWAVDIGSGAFLIHVIDIQRENEVPGAAPLTDEFYFPTEVDGPVAVSNAAPVLQMPMVTIEARPPRGLTEMQGTDDPSAKPAKVTHPEAKEPPVTPGR